MLHGTCFETFAARPAPANPWRALELDMPPLSVASALRPRGGLVFLDTGRGGESARSFVTAAPVKVLQGHIESDWSLVSQALHDGNGTPGGLFGWVGYDGRFVFGLYPHLMIFHHRQQRWTECGALSECITPSVCELPPAPTLEFHSQVPREDFLCSVERAQDYIAAGDIYQVNLAHSWRADWPKDADGLALHARLREISPAPYGAYVDLAGTRIISSSLESFLHMEGGTITTRPIKGTRPRFPDSPAKDRQSALDLVGSHKESAELLMITDLLRNDLGMVCEFGSIHVPELARVESFAQVFHLVSTVTGTLRPEVDHTRAFRACFPGGSITGAPKRRAREIISELEAHPRGIYTGALGYFGFDGESEFSIVIRTAVQQGGSITFHAGAGIVADSVPALEHEETLHKASGLLRAAKP